MSQAQTVSINKIRADTVVAWRGLVILVYAPVFCLIPLIAPIVRGLPHVDLAPLRSPLVWLLVALIVAGSFAARRGLAGMTARGLWIVVIGSCLSVGGGLVFVVSTRIIDPTQLAQKSVGSLLSVAALLIVILIALYWMLLSPTMAALRLLATRVPPDGTPLPTVLASPLPQGGAGDRVAAFKKWSPAAVAYRAAAAALGIVGIVTWLWLMVNDDERLMAVAGLFALVLIVTGSYCVRMLWRRGRQLAAIDAQAALRSDPRRPILYLRSFRDDPLLMEGEWGLLVHTDGRAARRRDRVPIARAFYRMSTKLQETTGGGGGRLEESLSAIVAPIGPFVAVGAPGEPLPELGAARAYFTDDTWQNEVIEWMNMAQLIVAVAGPTHSLRWEFDTILSRNAWAKLVILMPPSTADDNTAAWGNLVAALRDRPWHDAVAGLNQAEVVVMRLLEDGSLSVVTSCRRRMIDCVLAMRIMLHEMQIAVPHQPTS